MVYLFRRVGQIWLACVSSSRKNSTSHHGRFNASLRVTTSLAHVTPNAGYFSPGTCIATSWSVFSTLLQLWSQPHFKRTGKTLPTRRKFLRARQAVGNREEEGSVYSIPLFDLIGKLLEMQYNEINDSASISSTVPVAVE